MIIEERFMSQVDKTESGCWLWTGRMSPQGYGNTRVGGKSIGVHRLSYELFVGEIKGKSVIDHTCHNLKRSILTTAGRTHCKWGHELPSGFMRKCEVCQYIRNHARSSANAS